MLSRSPVARRGLLLGGAGAVLAVAAGCGTEDTAPASSAPTADAVGADSDLVERVVAEIGTALGAAAATARRHRRLRGLARPFADLHRTHLERLEADADDPGADAPADEAAARAALLRAEERLQRRLVAAAVDAESGALAQVFASMAAGVAQQREVSGA